MLGIKHKRINVTKFKLLGSYKFFWAISHYWVIRKCVKCVFNKTWSILDIQYPKLQYVSIRKNKQFI